ncbi:hypothetical protein AAKU64_003011 [Undibacterium sp. GrIS 1.8]
MLISAATIAATIVTTTVTAAAAMIARYSQYPLCGVNFK